MRRLGALLALVLACGPAAADPSFSTQEIRAILDHGPWPAPLAADPANRVSGRREAIELGERLFFDTRLSGSGKFSCGTCHVPERNWTDNRVLGRAAQEVDRNTPTLMNIRLARRFGWDGSGQHLWSQSIRPLLDRRELASSAGHVAKVIRSDPQLACRYGKAFDAPPSASDDEAVLADVGRALAAFQETFETPPTPFDQFRGALGRGERLPEGRYSEAARRGLRLFVGKATCATCHSGPNFSSGELAVNGFSGDGKAIKVPSLRHLFLTPPYGHDGRIGTLAEAVRHYAERGVPASGPLRLTAAEQSDLVVFLESLSTFSNPWRPEDLGRCQ